ncbi:MAG: hypothetical protein HY554_08605 [Elusimicrobia bacterium]|nr:hypothetical protein [Elusimicrobiota bacterium]
MGRSLNVLRAAGLLTVVSLGSHALEPDELPAVRIPPSEAQGAPERDAVGTPFPLMFARVRDTLSYDLPYYASFEGRDVFVIKSLDASLFVVLASPGLTPIRSEFTSMGLASEVSAGSLRTGAWLISDAPWSMRQVNVVARLFARLLEQGATLKPVPEARWLFNRKPS